MGKLQRQLKKLRTLAFQNAMASASVDIETLKNVTEAIDAELAMASDDDNRGVAPVDIAIQVSDRAYDETYKRVYERTIRRLGG